MARGKTNGALGVPFAPYPLKGVQDNSKKVTFRGPDNYQDRGKKMAPWSAILIIET
jgi:hypothetical protein